MAAILLQAEVVVVHLAPVQLLKGKHNVQKEETKCYLEIMYVEIILKILAGSNQVDAVDAMIMLLVVWLILTDLILITLEDQLWVQ
jgi:hypothetical protein